MDLTQFPGPLQNTFNDLFNALENIHHDHPEVVIKFLRALILKYGLGAEVLECKEYADGCVQTDDNDGLQGEKDSQPNEDVPPSDVQEQQEQQVWNLKSLAEDVRAVAQETLNLNQSQSFVYDDRSGTYYNYEQQCYYIPQHKLYYYVQNKAYYTYDEENHCMKFYSSSDHDSQNDSTNPGTTDGNVNSSKSNSYGAVGEKAIGSDAPSKHNTIKPNKPPRPKDEDIEEGEIVESDEEEEGEIRDDNDDYGYICVESPPAAQSATPSVIMASPTRIDLNIEPADHCAPCVRITVRESKIKGLDVGQLFIITRSGGTLGRDGQHDILLPDSNVSKEHLSFHYKYSEGMDVYEIVDYSRNGTVLDGFSLENSKPYRLGHGSVLKVGSTTLVCHIHDGTDTCTECEPSCLGFMTPASPPPPMASSGNLRTRHAAEMTQIKRKFGLKGRPLVPKLPKGYEDKSKIRRETIGSSHDSEKTDAVSTEEPIRSDNKGYAMLSKMGWKKGEGVGKSGEGTKSPVNVTVKMSKRGLGCPEDVTPLPKPKTKAKALEITKKRYEECE